MKVYAKRTLSIRRHDPDLLTIANRAASTHHSRVTVGASCAMPGGLYGPNSFLLAGTVSIASCGPRRATKMRATRDVNRARNMSSERGLNRVHVFMKTAIPAVRETEGSGLLIPTELAP